MQLPRQRHTQSLHRAFPPSPRTVGLRKCSVAARTDRIGSTEDHVQCFWSSVGRDSKIAVRFIRISEFEFGCMEFIL